MLVRPQPSQLRPRSSNGRISGSESEDAWFESRPRSFMRTRHGVSAASKTAARGFDSFRPCFLASPAASRREREHSSPGRLAARIPAPQAGGAGSSPARGASRDRGVSGSTGRRQRWGSGSTPGGRFRLPWPRPAPAGQSPASPAARRAEAASVGCPCSSTVPPPYATSARRQETRIGGLWCERQHTWLAPMRTGFDSPGLHHLALGRAWGAARLSPG